ncbi:transmembrane protease serine 11G-like [Gordionus sp. m RMFG-2023]|uniref:transmembrane protease serine 11G-like n=1 Tax=Gordionus sp. m RMFG-2023 TaxID=3053472 RepID=UPI0031FDF0B8
MAFNSSKKVNNTKNKNTSISLEARILNGVPSKRGSWPWQASIRYKGIHSCGGSLVADKYVITASHCQFSRRNPSDITLSFGTLFSGNVNDEFEQMRRAVRVTEHEGFNNGLKFNNDIAIIELDSPVQYNDYISPICLPTKEYSVGSLCYVTGYGSTKGTGVENVLNEVAIPIIASQQCSDPNWLGDKVNENMICAGGDEKDSCQGDSGGPFQCLDESEGNIWTLTGVVSWGIDCGKVTKPGVYTNVFNYINWLEQRIPL